MSEPTTEAGRALLRYLREAIVTTDERRAGFRTDVVAIEREAYAKVRAAVDRLPTEYQRVDKSAVLAAIVKLEQDLTNIR